MTKCPKAFMVAKQRRGGVDVWHPPFTTHIYRNESIILHSTNLFYLYFQWPPRASVHPASPYVAVRQQMSAMLEAMY